MLIKDFSLPDQEGKIHSLRDYLGKWVVLYFYPRDDTPGCTKEACEFRDSFKELQNLGVVILGVSKDTVVSHMKFAEKYQLNFTLLSDESKEVITAYGAWGKKKFLGKEYFGIIRKTYLISPDGNVAKVYEKVNPLTHAEEILKDVQSFRA